MKRHTASILVIGILFGTAVNAAERPNVLYISIEDIAPLMGCYGHPVVKTPHIDGLAGRGVVFHNAYCQVAVCNPSRASVSSGLRPETTGVFNNSVDWRRRLPEGHRTLPEYFRDHGYETVICGKIHHHQRYYKDRKYTLFESSARVPLVIVAPGVTEAGAVCKRPTELIDMYPTLADLSRLGVPDGLEGISMKPLLADPSRPWKKAAFTSKGPGQVSVRTQRWRYTEWGSPDKAELYDHESDPDEFTNLAGQPEYSATVAELRKLLHGGWRAALPGSQQ